LAIEGATSCCVGCFAVVRSPATTCEHGQVKFNVLVEVRLQPGIADPQGSTIERSLPHLGFEGITGVGVGKAIRFSCEGADQAAVRNEVEDMCKRFLTNPVIEDAFITIDEA
jgi:phosphoribosylformylglycinamidine synthase PurS subunit